MEKELMNKEVLCILDTRQIQRFMFKSNSYLDTLGGSDLVNEVQEKAIRYAVTHIDPPLQEEEYSLSLDPDMEIPYFTSEKIQFQLLTCSAGNAMCLVRTGALCQKIIRKISRFYLDYAYSLNLVAAVTEKTDDFGRDIFHLYKKLNAIKASCDISDPVGPISVVVREQRTGQPAIGRDEKTGEYYSRSSNTLLLNEKGMPTCRAEDLLSEIEYVLGISGKLRIAGKYTGVYHDYSRNHLWQEDRNAVRCFAKGSILRLEVIGDPIDIFPIRHCFIGERTQEGYGEICTWPAQGGYYRLAEKVVLPRYDVYARETPRNIILGARMTKSVITAILKNKVQALAAVDQNEYSAGAALEELLPAELLEMFRDQYDPLLTSEEVSLWYSEKLKGGHTCE